MLVLEKSDSLGKKICAGVDFIQTQAIFDMQRFEEFMKELAKLDEVSVDLEPFPGVAHRPAPAAAGAT